MPAADDCCAAGVLLGTSVSEGVWEVAAAGTVDVVGTISEDGGKTPVDAGLCSSGVFRTWEDDGSCSGVETSADDDAATTDEVGSSGTELTTIVVVVGSSGVVLGAAALEETISGVVSTGAVDGAGAEETCSGVVEDGRPADEEELPVLEGG